MDLSTTSFGAEKSNEGVWMTITDPITGEDTDVSLKLTGQDSKIFKEKVMKISEKSRQTKKGLSPAKSMEMLKGVYVACTLEWKNVELDGSKLKCTEQNIKKVYTDYPFIYDQVVEFVEDRANFL